MSKINKIDTDGKLTITETIVYGRKIPLTTIVQEETKRFRAAGIYEAKTNRHALQHQRKLTTVMKIKRPIQLINLNVELIKDFL